MKQSSQPSADDHISKLYGIFPTSIYSVKRKYLEETGEEEKEIEDIIKEGMLGTKLHQQSLKNSTIFDTKLKNIKEFCEKHIKKYVKEVISPKNEELDFYITQSWLNIVKPGGYIHRHSHTNSIISGAFYISMEKDDKIVFYDPNSKMKNRPLKFTIKDDNAWNSLNWILPVEENQLLLFPSWLEHSVEINEKATKDRISISFNTFVKGTLGERQKLNELTL